MSEPDNETYPDGPGWVTPGYPHLPPSRRPDLPAYGTGSGGQVVRYAGREPPTNPHWVPPRPARPGPEPEPEQDPQHVDRRRGLRLAGILIIAVVVLGVAAMVLFRMAGH